ncbi:MAG: hypothetical protein ACRC0X_02100 [Brevinema sp.]
MSNNSPQAGRSTNRSNPIIGEIPSNGLTVGLSLVGDSVGEKEHYMDGLLCVVNLDTGTAKPCLLGDVNNTAVYGILMDNISGLANGETSTQKFNLVYRNVTVSKKNIVLREGTDEKLENIVKTFREKQNCTVIEG